MIQRIYSALAKSTWKETIRINKKSDCNYFTSKQIIITNTGFSFCHLSKYKLWLKGLNFILNTEVRIFLVISWRKSRETVWHYLAKTLRMSRLFLSSKPYTRNPNLVNRQPLCEHSWHLFWVSTWRNPNRHLFPKYSRKIKNAAYLHLIFMNLLL